MVKSLSMKIDKHVKLKGYISYPCMKQQTLGLKLVKSRFRFIQNLQRDHFDIKSRSEVKNR